MEKLLTAEDVAQLLNVSTAWVYDYATRKHPQFLACAWASPCASGGKDTRTFIEAITRRIRLTA